MIKKLLTTQAQPYANGASHKAATELSPAVTSWPMPAKISQSTQKLFHVLDIALIRGNGDIGELFKTPEVYEFFLNNHNVQENLFIKWETQLPYHDFDMPKNYHR